MKVNESLVNLTIKPSTKNNTNGADFGNLINAATSRNVASREATTASNNRVDDARANRTAETRNNRADGGSRNDRTDRTSDRTSDRADRSTRETTNSGETTTDNTTETNNTAGSDNTTDQTLDTALENATDQEVSVEGGVQAPTLDLEVVLEETAELEETQVVGTPEEEATIDENEVIAQFAALIAPIVDVPVEQVIEIITDEQIAVEHLTQHETLQTIMTEVYELDEVVDLLGVENITQTMQELTEVVQNFEPMAVVAPTTDGTNVITIENETENIVSQIAVTTEQVTEEIPMEMMASGEQTQQNQENLLGQTEVAPDINIMQGTATTVNNIMTTEVETPLALAASPEEIINQVKDEIKTSFRGMVSEIKMILKPESLGEISLKIQSHNGVVTAQFTAQSQRIKEILEQNMGDLKEELEKQGIQIQQLSVSVSTEDRSSEFMDNFNREQEKSQSRMSSIVNNIMNEEVEQVAPEEIQSEDTKVHFRA